MTTEDPARGFQPDTGRIEVGIVKILVLAAGFQVYGGPRSLSHDFTIWPITFQVSGPILFSCEKISL